MSRKGHHSPNQKNVGFPKHPIPKTRPKLKNLQLSPSAFGGVSFQGQSKGFDTCTCVWKMSLKIDIHNICKNKIQTNK